jgi:hypothetical protein
MNERPTSWLLSKSLYKPVGNCDFNYVATIHKIYFFPGFKSPPKNFTQLLVGQDKRPNAL